MEAWIADAAVAGIEMPSDIKLKPIQRFKRKVTGNKVSGKNANKKWKRPAKKTNGDPRFNKYDAEERAAKLKTFTEQMELHTAHKANDAVLATQNPKNGEAE